MSDCQIVFASCTLHALPENQTHGETAGDGVLRLASCGAHDSLRPAPQEPPPLASLVSQLGPPFYGCRGQSMRQRVGGEAFQISAPSIKDDAVPRVRKAADGGKCDGGAGGNRHAVQQSRRWMSRADVRWGPRF
jgi:hypothetical protein